MRKACFLLIFFLVFFVFVRGASAEGEFYTFVEASYTLTADGGVNVQYDIELENATDGRYPSSYKLVLESSQPDEIVVWEGNNRLDYRMTKTASGSEIEFDFKNPAVGRGGVSRFSIQMVDHGLAQHTGEVWEIYLPKLASLADFNSYRVKLSVPEEFGNASYVSPEALERSSEGGMNIYRFSLDTSGEGVTAAFGEFQAFGFDLTYHLSNSNQREEVVEIAIVPDTAFQRVYYDSIRPVPMDIYVTEEGNWMAKYKLAANERMDVKIAGKVKLYSSGAELIGYSSTVLEKNLKPSKYWQSDNEQIKNLASQLASPRAIYDWVVDRLEYDYARVGSEVERRGALGALENPSSSICMEYTDLFIALARSAGIPAREVNGYAYTDNPEIQPLGLVLDVLHAWPEYWDFERETWIPVDPTWEDTTGGVDYFNKLDLRHISFVIHGFDPTKPNPPGSYKLGDNPQKDVYVSHVDKFGASEGALQVDLKAARGLYFAKKKLTGVIYNPGPTALYDKQFDLYFGEQRVGQYSYEVIPAYSTKLIDVEVPMKFLEANAGHVSLVGDSVSVYEFNHGKETLVSLIIVFGTLGLISAIAVFVIWKRK